MSPPAPAIPLRTAAVFGASGKLGRRMVAALRARGVATRALVHRTPLDATGVEAVTGDIADPRVVATVVAGADLVVHLATAKEDAATFFDASIRGTFNVLEAARTAKVRQVLLVGGDAALGIWFYPSPAPLTEESPLRAYPGHYAFSKVIEETMARQYALQYGLPVTVLRSSWVFEGDDLLRHFSLLRNIDPAEPGHGFGEITPEIMDLVRRRWERIPILVDAQGAPLRRHIVHLDDVLQAFGLMLGNPAALGRTFNIAGPAPFDYAAAAALLSSRLMLPTVTLRCPAYHGFEIDISRARRELGYAPENDFARMAERAIAARISP
ncbi:MAG: NAD(P)-dependent oxidoreductase [Opitutaceae bacterium]|nr:NAD(P)-dependent oxidoreductase [Opitutaceae bacterium]